MTVSPYLIRRDLSVDPSVSGMSFDAGEAVELNERVSDEIPVVEDFSNDYRVAASAFVEQNFPGGPEAVHEDLPDDAEMLPRYIAPEEVAPKELEEISEDAAHLANFTKLRGESLEQAAEDLNGTDSYRFFSTGSTTVKGSSLASSLQLQRSQINNLEDEIRAVAEFLEPVEEIAFRPAYWIEQLYHTEDGSVAEPGDLDFAEEKYWPFDAVAYQRN